MIFYNGAPNKHTNLGLNFEKAPQKHNIYSIFNLVDV